LKKRTKKLLFSAVYFSGNTRQFEKVFCFFFSKKKCLLFLPGTILPLASRRAERGAPYVGGSGTNEWFAIAAPGKF